MNEKLIIHPLPAVWDASSRVLLLGTMPSPASRAQGFYYGHPQNRFWKVMAMVLQQPEPDNSVEQRKKFLLQNRIALFDVLQSCRIRGAADTSIREPVPNDFEEIFSGADIQAVFTTGTKAYTLYEKLCLPKTGREAICLPSTSAANCRMSLEVLKEQYQIICEYL